MKRGNSGQGGFRVFRREGRGVRKFCDGKKRRQPGRPPR
nr:MAG TPA: hypothetical protein [Caudoviricetes sp.]